MVWTVHAGRILCWVLTPRRDTLGYILNKGHVAKIAILPIVRHILRISAKTTVVSHLLLGRKSVGINWWSYKLTVDD
jgi:hypothetical protein